MLQNGVLRIRQSYGIAHAFHAVTGKIHIQVADGQAAFVLAPVLPVAPQQGIDLGQQLPMGEGLGEKVVPAAAVGREHVLLGGLGRQEKNGGLGQLPQSGTGGEAVQARHHHIQNDQIRLRVGGHILNGTQAVAGLRHKIFIF